MNVLALDLSLTKTGWAARIEMRDGSYGICSGAISFPVTDKKFPHQRFGDFANWLQQRIQIQRPDLIVFEENTARGWDAEALIGLKMRLLEICAAHRIPTKSIYPSSLKLFITGNGRADKAAMQEAISARFDEYSTFEDKGADIADALSLILWSQAGCPPSKAALERIAKKAKSKAKSKAKTARKLARKSVVAAEVSV